MKNLKPGKSIRIAIDFNDVPSALRFVEELNELEIFGEGPARVAGVREADGLDLQRSEAYTLLVRTRRDVEGHPGAVLPLPEREEGESVADYRERLDGIQRAALDRLTEEVID